MDTRSQEEIVESVEKSVLRLEEFARTGSFTQEERERIEASIARLERLSQVMGSGRLDALTERMKNLLR